VKSEGEAREMMNCISSIMSANLHGKRHQIRNYIWVSLDFFVFNVIKRRAPEGYACTKDWLNTSSHIFWHDKSIVTMSMESWENFVKSHK